MSFFWQVLPSINLALNGSIDLPTAKADSAILVLYTVFSNWRREGNSKKEVMKSSTQQQVKNNSVESVGKQAHNRSKQNMTLWRAENLYYSSSK